MSTAICCLCERYVKEGRRTPAREIRVYAPAEYGTAEWRPYQRFTCCGRCCDIAWRDCCKLEPMPETYKETLAEKKKWSREVVQLVLVKVHALHVIDDLEEYVEANVQIRLWKPWSSSW